ncbi:MAG: 2-oxoacid:acceptor oxidoreductase subunit alpha [Solirubrobacterales bacterium]|nr:2-oxoacid:acceptor oxidoreductase subunit alpha [Solirubrobacterales bacterium]
MALPDITLQLAGESGEGVISGGDILTAGAARAGYWGLTFRTYPAEIKGGPCMFQLRIGADRIRSIGNETGLLVCFNQEGFDLQHGTVGPEGIVIADAESCKVTDEFAGRSFEVAFSQIAEEAGGSRRGKNMVIVGMTCGLLDVDTEQIENLILKRYAHKGDVGESNIASLRAGVIHARENLPDVCNIQHPKEPERERILLSGNQAIVAGALHAGLTYYAGYPITPASDILESLAARLPRMNGVAIQTEDEIAALASVLGASFTGAKAMTATSGPGLSLMAELIGLAGTAEIPSVIIDAQRAGPSTGMPTKTEQSDLNQAVYGSHGEAPRVVIAPTTVDDCLVCTVDAFNAAETYQVPVILLSDQSLSHRLETVDRPDLSTIAVENRVTPNGSAGDQRYQRYELTESGVSPMAIPGAPGAYVSTGIEHDELGHPGYTPELHIAMQDKRFKKLDPLRETGRVTVSGPEQARVGILGWGSTEGAAVEAAEMLRERGVSAATFYPRILAPLPIRRIQDWAEGMETIFVPEVNYTGQFARILRADCGIEVVAQSQITGYPFTAADIADFIAERVPSPATATA